MSLELARTYYPHEMDLFAEGGDAWVALNQGRHITLDRQGFIVEIWDPSTGKQYDELGHEIGDRNKPKNNITKHKMDYITLFPGVTTMKLWELQKKGKISLQDIGLVLDRLKEGLEVTVDARGNIVHVRRPSDGHEMSKDVQGQDVTVTNPTAFPAKTLPFEPEDSTTWTALEYMELDGTAHFTPKGGFQPGTGGAVPLADLTIEQMELAVTNIDASLGKDMARYNEMIALIADDKFDQAQDLMDANDGEFFAADEELNAENLKEYALSRVLESRELDEEYRFLRQRLQNSIAEKRALREHPENPGNPGTGEQDSGSESPPTGYRRRYK